MATKNPVKLTKAEKFNIALTKKDTNEVNVVDKHVEESLTPVLATGSGAARTKELEYKKLDLKSQILLRPDTYIGSVKRNKTTDPVWIFRNGKMIQDYVQYTDGFLRLFIEIISNSIDNVWRSSEFKIPCKYIKVDIDYENNLFSVWNDGKPIPLTIHPEEKVYIPEMIFGHFLTSSNYNDNEERKTSGTNGYGSKLTACFSTEFNIECFNPSDGMIYKQRLLNNLSVIEKPELLREKNKFPKTIDDGKNGYSKITWKPELSRFDMKSIDSDIRSVIEKYIIDAAMTVFKYGVEIIYNGNKIKMKDYKDLGPLSDKKLRTLRNNLNNR
jgi:DNA topoisomerase-2